MKTRNVDVTVTSLLEGRIKFDPVPNTENDITPRVTQSLPVMLPKTKPKKQNVGKFSIEECHRTFEERKKMLLEQARRSVIIKDIYKNKSQSVCGKVTLLQVYNY